ncbi:hypothetical protein Cni_G28211 [Canna indica]|uniref:Uncharacterized protein n=1 Tax=Canna indica TaxID=4628 RepID=A0AAQ3L293_9LILI|nr:hypothetical protein Cni_G28211 [Canna indica]
MWRTQNGLLFNGEASGNQSALPMLLSLRHLVGFLPVGLLQKRSGPSPRLLSDLHILGWLTLFNPPSMLSSSNSNSQSRINSAPSMPPTSASRNSMPLVTPSMPAYINGGLPPPSSA